MLALEQMKFDGVSRGNPSILRAGVIFRDALGEVIKATCKSLESNKNNVAQFSTLRIGLLLALDSGLKKIV